jgi:tRNA(Ile)-lysidine synthase
MAIESGAEPSRATADTFLAVLAEGLPRVGFWESPVVVAVSGGADSVALLIGLVRLAAAEQRGRLIVAHAEHDLREAAAADREFVATLAAGLGLAFASRRLAVRRDVDGRGEGIEARARRLRYDFLLGVAHESGARHVAVAHTADDQAETILHRILRGTGLTGLAGMEPARELGDGVALVRPLLGTPRSMTRGFLTALAQPWCEDETNADARFARNFLRHEIIAACERGPYPAATEALVRLGSQAGAVAAAVRSAAEHLVELHATTAADGRVVLRATGLGGLAPHLLAEMFVVIWSRQGWPRCDMTAAHYERLANLVRAAETSATGSTDYPGGVRVNVSTSGRLLMQPPLLTVSGPAREPGSHRGP